MITLSIVNVPLAQIHPSPTNPRKTFAPGPLAELADSIKAKGVISPITVRLLQDEPDEGDHELVVGERRWRAAKLAGLAEIPCIVRDLDDQEVLELQLIENAQRADVHPLEEADGYERLISEHGYDVDRIADKTGKSKATIYARLKLCALAAVPREAFLEGRLSASVALLIARIPDTNLQDRATRDVLGETEMEHLEDRSEEERLDLDRIESPLAEDRRSITVGLDSEGFPVRERIPMSVREAQIHLQRRYMLRLALAKFPVDDANLVHEAGACTSCEFRTGNQRELFSDVDGEDICTRPSCFEQKTRASWELQAAAATDQGIKVVPAEDAARVFTPSAQIRQSSPYVDPKSPVPYDLLPAGTTKAPTFEKLLGKRLLDSAPKVLVQDLSGAGHELLDKKAVIEALREAGKIDKPLKPEKNAKTGSKDPYKDDAAREEKKRGQWERAAFSACEDAFTAAAKIKEGDLGWWRWLASWLTATTSKSYDAMIESAKTRAELQQVVTAVVLEDLRGGCSWSDPAKDVHLMRGLAVVGVDYGEHIERIKESDKAAEKAEKAAAKSGAKEKADDGNLCGLVDGKRGKGCIHELGHDGLHSDGGRTWSTPKKKGARR